MQLPFEVAQTLAIQQQCLSVKQEGSIAEYKEQFKLISLQLEDVNKGILIIIFVNRLEERIQVVRLVDPLAMLQCIIERVRRLEAKNHGFACVGLGMSPKPRILELPSSPQRSGLRSPWPNLQCSTTLRDTSQVLTLPSPPARELSTILLFGCFERWEAWVVECISC